MENAPLDSDAEAYVDVVLKQRSKRVSATEPIHVDSAYHKDLEMLVSEWKDGTVEIAYNHPRLGLAVAQGTILFRRFRDGVRYSGTAYTFKGGCVTVTGCHLSIGRLKIDMASAQHAQSF